MTFFTYIYFVQSTLINARINIHLKSKHMHSIHAKHNEWATKKKQTIKPVSHWGETHMHNLALPTVMRLKSSDQWNVSYVFLCLLSSCFYCLTAFNFVFDKRKVRFMIIFFFGFFRLCIERYGCASLCWLLMKLIEILCHSIDPFSHFYKQHQLTTSKWPIITKEVYQIQVKASVLW